MADHITRRRYLYSGGVAGLVGLAGCAETIPGNGGDGRDTTTHETSNLQNATFTFDYSPENKEVTVTFTGGPKILAGDLELRSTAGKQVLWAELGSTVSAPDEQISPGATATLSASTINWDQPVSRNSTIRLVHIGKETPATLGRFSPPTRTTLSTTVPKTTTTTTAQSTSTTTETTTETATTQAEDTTAPSIAAFSISNPRKQRIRISFDTEEQLATITVSLEDSISQRLTASDFSISSNQSGTYTYEASLDADTTGRITATLLEASDQAGNDGASNETVSLTIQASTPDALKTVFHHKLSGSYADAANNITGEPAANAVEFTDQDRGQVLTLTGRGANSKGGYYDIPYADLSQYVDEGSAITTAFWARPDTLDQWYAYFVGTGISVNTRHGKLRINRWDRETREQEYKATIDVEAALTAGSWQHIIATVEPGAEARLFVNGEKMASTPVDADQGFKQKQGDNIDAARVGWVASGIDGPDAHYQGDLDDFRFFTGSVKEDGARQLFDAMSE